MRGALGAFNEWDVLREVIVGRIDDARFPAFDRILRRTIPEEAMDDYERLFELGGQPIPPAVLEQIDREMSGFLAILEANDIEVHRPDTFDFSRPFSTPDWAVPSGVSCANPRDVFLLVGDVIIECPMADRGRYYESFPYRPLLLRLSERGYRWISAPKPRLNDDLYDRSGPFAIGNNEPLFDAADFVRCGDTLIGQRSHVTNDRGIAWLRSILGDVVDIKIVESNCPAALHIDTTIVPLEERTVLVNPEFIDIPTFQRDFDAWTVIVAPPPETFYTQVGGYRIVSDWMSLNVLNIGRRTVIVEEKQRGLQAVLEANNFDVIPCPFESYYILGGSFHCATLDIRRG